MAGLTSDGRLAVFDFGAVATVHRSALGFLDSLRLAELANSVELAELPGQLQTVVLAELAAAMRSIGFSDPGARVQPEDVLAYFGPFVEPL